MFPTIVFPWVEGRFCFVSWFRLEWLVNNSVNTWGGVLRVHRFGWEFSLHNRFPNFNVFNRCYSTGQANGIAFTGLIVRLNCLCFMNQTFFYSANVTTLGHESLYFRLFFRGNGLKIGVVCLLLNNNVFLRRIFYTFPFVFNFTSLFFYNDCLFVSIHTFTNCHFATNRWLRLFRVRLWNVCTPRFFPNLWWLSFFCIRLRSLTVNFKKCGCFNDFGYA